MENLHVCVDGRMSDNVTWWARDGRGIALCRVCDGCADEKLSVYRPAIFEPYSELDVDENIEPDGDW